MKQPSEIFFDFLMVQKEKDFLQNDDFDTSAQ